MSVYDCNTMQEVYETKFKKIYSDKILANMTIQEKKQYYEELRCYLKTLDYDKDKIELDEKHFLKAAKYIIPAFELLFNPQSINVKTENSSNEVGNIYVCNHVSSLDQFAVISALGKDKPLHILASDTLLNLKRGILYKYAGCIFIDLKNVKKMFAGLEEVEKILLDGKDVLIFPEGTRNFTENFILPFLPGAIMAARDTGARIIPLAINDNLKLFSKNLFVRQGKDFIDDLNDSTVESSKKLQEHIASLIWDNMELEREMNTNITREKLIKTHKRKQLAIEKQREKIRK